MIQRIQTIYLLIITALMAVTLFAPLAWFAVGGEQFDLYAFALRSQSGEMVRPPLYTGIVLALACALPLVNVFLFKRRMLQIRLCVVEMVLLAGSEAMLAAFYYFGHADAEFQGMKPAIILPLICLVFAWLAARAVFRDEMLVRSMNRIR